MPALPWDLARFYPLKAAKGYQWDFPLQAKGVIDYSRGGCANERSESPSSTHRKAGVCPPSASSGTLKICATMGRRASAAALYPPSSCSIG
jgi:hypothetical protein